MVQGTNQVIRSFTQSYADFSIGFWVVSNCLELLIWQDPYTEQLIRSRPSSGSPLIHRGYWSRVEAIRQSVLRFVQEAPAKEGVQVVTWYVEIGNMVGLQVPMVAAQKELKSIGKTRCLF